MSSKSLGVESLNNEEKLNFYLSELNQEFSQYGITVELNSFDTLQIENPNNLDLFISRGFITPQNAVIIRKFQEYINNYSFDYSIDRIKSDILCLEDLTDEEFEKYNYLVNFLQSQEYMFEQTLGEALGKQPALIDGKGVKWWGGCATALASNALASVSLSSCFAPGPWCWVAVAGKGLALASIYFSCT